MNNRTMSEPTESRKDSPEAGLRALKRAAERAREIARATGTPLVYEVEGELVYEYVTDEAPENGKNSSSTSS